MDTMEMNGNIKECTICFSKPSLELKILDIALFPELKKSVVDIISVYNISIKSACIL